MYCPKCKEQLPPEKTGKPWKFCVHCGEKLPKKLPDKIVIKMYLHGDKETSYSVAEEAGLSEEACKEFAYALYEVEFDVEIDTKTGKNRIIAVDGQKLMPKEKNEKD